MDTILTSKESDMQGEAAAVIVDQPARYNFERCTVRFLATVDESTDQYSISAEALNDLARSSATDEAALLELFNIHLPEILLVAARVFRSGRRQDYDSGSILLRSIDF